MVAGDIIFDMDKPKKRKVYRFNDGKLYDFSTLNTSFLKVADQLHKLGVKNWYFMLEIKDVSVLNINPHKCDADGHTLLNKDQISRVMTEVCTNPWYYLREIVRIPDQGGTTVPYKANRGNIAQAWCILHGLDSWLCLPRQQGKTTSALALFTWGYLYGTTNSKFIYVNKDGDNAKTNLRNTGNIINNLPEYLQGQYILNDEGKKEKQRQNATIMKNPISNNEINIKAKATSIDTAISLARGLSANILHFDEPEFTNHIKEIIANSVSTYETAAANAKRNGAMYCRCFTCTPYRQMTY